jgi:hypothetical protein
MLPEFIPPHSLEGALVFLADVADGGKQDFMHRTIVAAR